MADTKETLTVVVGGEPTEVAANEQAPLRTIIPDALKQTGQIGQPPEAWEIKDAAGNVLNLGRKIADYGFSVTTTLFLSLKAGVGG